MELHDYIEHVFVQFSEVRPPCIRATILLVPALEFIAMFLTSLFRCLDQLISFELLFFVRRHFLALHSLFVLPPSRLWCRCAPLSAPHPTAKQIDTDASSLAVLVVRTPAHHGEPVLAASRRPPEASSCHHRLDRPLPCVRCTCWDKQGFRL